MARLRAFGSLRTGALLQAVLLLVGSAVAVPAKVPEHATLVDRQNVNANYTFIIAGGGIAGLTLADRLTEDPSVTVLVIEAGPFDAGQEGILIPGAFAPFLYFWPGLVTPPQPGLNGRAVGGVCAQVVGGGSAINAMVYLRGDEGDYETWGDLGNHGWSWNSIFPYFKKGETFTPPATTQAAAANITWDASVRGTSGPVQYSYPNYFYPGSANWFNAAKSVGINPTKDPLGGKKPGVYWIPTVLDAATKTRSYARRNHYERVKASRPNYHILASNQVAKVLFQNKKAIGVEYFPTQGGSTSRVYASKEIILAAGGIHTPQILQLSGVGPKKLLDKFRIPVVENLPGVGANLQDQPTLPVPHTFTNNLFPNADSMTTNTTYNAEQRALYNSGQSSAYTIISGLSTNIATLSLRVATNDWLRIIAQAALSNPAASLPDDTDPTVFLGYLAQRALTLKQFADPEVGVGTLHWSTGATATVYHLKPLSRGTVYINTTDPRASPIIDYRTATDPIDIEVYTALFKKNRQLFASSFMQALGPTEQAPFKDAVTDKQIETVLRNLMNPSNAHQCCTAAMMPRALGGVVDHEQRVYGVSGLRVADISFWPMQIAAAPTATMYASAERLADLIKKAYGIRSL